MSDSSLSALWSNFLGESPNWYKQTIIGFIVINPLLLMVAGPVFTGWALIAEFIFTLALALRCYPLQPGGLLAIEGILLGLADPHSVFHEAEANFEVILLLMFMVAGIYFMKDLLLFVFTKILLNVRSKKLLAFLFSIVSAVLSAFLDALTVTAVLISVGVVSLLYFTVSRLAWTSQTRVMTTPGTPLCKRILKLTSRHSGRFCAAC